MPCWPCGHDWQDHREEKADWASALNREPVTTEWDQAGTLDTALWEPEEGIVCTGKQRQDIQEDFLEDVVPEPSLKG